MRIVIDIDEKLYAVVTSDFWCGNYAIQQVIKNGTPLPKGHGRLIDADELYEHVVDKYSEGEQLAIDITDAPTVIEADTETWNSCHGQVTVPKGTMERIYNEADNVHDKEMI